MRAETFAGTFRAPPLSSSAQFDVENPQIPNEQEAILVNTLTITLTDFDIAADKFSNTVLEGQFTLTTAGIFKSPTTDFLQGTVSGILQH